MPIKLNDKRVRVTGDLSGLGAAMLHPFGAASVKVAINYIADPEEADALVDGIKNSGSEAITIQADASDPAAVEANSPRWKRRWAASTS